MSKIIIEPYDPAWPGIFVQARHRLLDAVGEWVLEIEHIGSTAVQGLSAKPVIDLMMGVRSLSEADSFCLTPISQLGYVYIGEFETQLPHRRYFRKPKTSQNLEHHLHLVEKGSEFWLRHLAFRDYLRQNPQTAMEYETLKRILASQFIDGNEYASAKTTFIRKTEEVALIGFEQNGIKKIDKKPSGK